MSDKQTLGSWVFNHVVALLFCVLFPGFVTAIAPVSWLHLQRTTNGVSAQAYICCFFFIPYQNLSVSQVHAIDDQFVRGTTSRSRSEKKETKSEDEGFLIVQGETQSIRVPVSPFSMKRAKERVQKFLDDDAQSALHMTLVANWKFSIIAGGLVSLLTVLYVVGVTLSIAQAISKLIFGSFGAARRTAS